MPAIGASTTGVATRSAAQAQLVGQRPLVAAGARQRPWSEVMRPLCRVGRPPRSPFLGLGLGAT